MAPPSHPETSGPDLGTRSILLVEDEPLLRAFLLRILHAEGYSVLTARDGKEALDLSERHEGSIGVLLTDIWMPRLSGFELAERLAAQRPGLQVLFLSGDPEATYRGDEWAVAKATVIGKPFATADLIRQVRQAVEHASREQP